MNEYIQKMETDAYMHRQKHKEAVKCVRIHTYINRYTWAVRGSGTDICIDI
jgi:hypothetical protein